MYSEAGFRKSTCDTCVCLQRRDGSFLIGETHPSEAANTDTSAAAAQRILALATAAIPALSDADVAGMDVGYRPYPADGLPVVGWLPGDMENVYVAGKQQQ